MIRGVRSVAVLQCSIMVPYGDSNNQDVGQRQRGWVRHPTFFVLVYVGEVRTTYLGGPIPIPHNINFS